MEAQAEIGVSATENAGKVESETNVKPSEDKVENGENETVIENDRSEDDDNKIEDKVEENGDNKVEKEEDKPEVEAVSDVPGDDNEAADTTEGTALNTENSESQEKEKSGIVIIKFNVTDNHTFYFEINRE